MYSFIKSVNSSNAREAAIKSSITKQLSDCIKEIQMYSVGEVFSIDAIQEAETTLCTIIEAMFLHGVKDTFLHRARRAMTDLDEKPTPSFWPPILLISHRQTIQQVSSLSRITTEMGQCRAWVRVVLNDCLLSSYISTIQQNNSILKSYYKVHAYIRDSELLDVTRKIIEGVEAFTEFKLPINSSLLNNWPIQTLILSGLWSPTLRACPVAAGVDVAQAIQTNPSINSDTVSINSSISYTSYTSGVGQSTFNEDEALKIILAQHSNDELKKMKEKKRKKRIPEVAVIDTPENAEKTESTVPELKDSGASSTGENILKMNNGETQLNNEDETELVKSTESYNALIQSYNMLGGGCIRTPDFFEIKPYVEKSKKDTEVKKPKDLPIPLVNNDDNELTVTYSLYIGKIANESGLDTQNYECADCKISLPLTPTPAVCNFTGKYFCDNCMASELVMLPARALHNWDFNEYRVSQGAFNYMQEVKTQPTIDLKTVNPYIYTVSTEMSTLQDLRVQLNFLRDYLYTCREPVVDELREKIGGREYMYEHVHQYSISDVLNIRNGVLLEELQKVVNFGKDHVSNCLLCKQKGFICEICNKPKVLYPFDMIDVFRCNICHGVYHNTCLNAIKPCPKCERLKKRNESLNKTV